MEEDRQYDMLVVGGGINGAGIARDAAGRGLSVVLCEQDDLADHISSASSKLIHGGLRDLEYYEFRLVSKALAEREVVLRAAPHIVWPLLLADANSPGDLGDPLGGGPHATESAYLVRNEWPVTTKAIPWRRSELGFTAPPDTANRLTDWLAGIPSGSWREVSAR